VGNRPLANDLVAADIVVWAQTQPAVGQLVLARTRSASSIFWRLGAFVLRVSLNLTSDEWSAINDKRSQRWPQQQLSRCEIAPFRADRHALGEDGSSPRQDTMLSWSDGARSAMQHGSAGFRRSCSVRNNGSRNTFLEPYAVIKLALWKEGSQPPDELRG
jgi:hypothetical protein